MKPADRLLKHCKKGLLKINPSLNNNIQLTKAIWQVIENHAPSSLTLIGMNELYNDLLNWYHEVK